MGLGHTLKLFVIILFLRSDFFRSIMKTVIHAYGSRTEVDKIDAKRLNMRLGTSYYNYNGYVPTIIYTEKGFRAFMSMAKDAKAYPTIANVQNLLIVLDEP